MTLHDHPSAWRIFRLINEVRTRLVLLVIFVPLLSACLDAPEDPLRVGTNRWPGYEPLFLARDLKAFEGTRIRLVELPSATDVIHALRNKTLEAATLTLDEALTLLQDGVDLEIVLVMDISNGADALVARPGIARLRDLRGRRVGVENTAVGALVLGAALDKAGLTAADIRVVPMTVDEHLHAYRRQQVDAVVTFDPVRSRLLAAGAEVLFDSSQIPGSVVDVLVVRREVAAAHGDTLRALLDGHFLALKHLEDHPRDAVQRMAPRLDLSPESLLASYDRISLPDLDDNHRLLGGTAPPMRNTARRLMRLMVRQGLLSRPVEIDRLLDARWLPERTS